MQIGRETILRRRDGIEQHDRADLPPVAYAVGVSDEAVQALVEEATRLIVGYLTG
jgi:hypothetical protein